MVVMSQRNEQTSDNEETRLAQAADTLSQLPRKPRSRRAQVEYLHASILDAIDKGYSYGELSALLAKESIDIPTRTLKQYVRNQKRQNAMLDEAEEEEEPAIVQPKPNNHKTNKPTGFVEMPAEL
ncbi:MAG: hypothetical protein RLZZ511_4398 [Cyanobacteriota bacterium]|jgi:uncharacterized Zn finger protein